MNIKVQAGLVVAGVIATSVAMPIILVSLALGIAVYTLYSIALAQLKYEEKLKEISKK